MLLRVPVALPLGAQAADAADGRTPAQRGKGSGSSGLAQKEQNICSPFVAQNQLAKRLRKRKKKKKRGSEDESRRSFHSDKTLQAEGQRVQKQHFANGENDEAYFLETVSDLTLVGEAVPGILFRLCPLGGGGGLGITSSFSPGYDGECRDVASARTIGLARGCRIECKWFSVFRSSSIVFSRLVPVL